MLKNVIFPLINFNETVNDRPRQTNQLWDMVNHFKNSTGNMVENKNDHTTFWVGILDINWYKYVPEGNLVKFENLLDII